MRALQERGARTALSPETSHPGAAGGVVPGRRGWWLAGVAAVVVGADQLTKSWALRALEDGPIEVVWTLRLRLTFNTGTAFSFGTGRGAVIALVAVAVVVAMVLASRSVTDRLGAAALGLVVGGALGNLLDRALRAGPGGADAGFMGGAVVDFVDLGWWPVFNVADTAIVVGGLLLAAVSWRPVHPGRTGA